MSGVFFSSHEWKTFFLPDIKLKECFHRWENSFFCEAEWFFPRRIKYKQFSCTKPSKKINKFRRFLSFLCLKPNEKNFRTNVLMIKTERNNSEELFSPVGGESSQFPTFFLPSMKIRDEWKHFSFLKIISKKFFPRCLKLIRTLRESRKKIIMSSDFFPRRIK